MITWAKTLLTAYRYLERVAKAIDRIVLTRAVNSFYTSGSNLSFNCIENVSSDILNLTERKVNLINLKLILESALESLQDKHSALLVTSFVESKNCYQCAELLNISLRTFFRRQNQALESFVKALDRHGYDDIFFNKMLESENWIAEIKSRYGKNSSNVEPDEKIESKIKILKQNFCQENAKQKLKGQNSLNLQTRNSLHF